MNSKIAIRFSTSAVLLGLLALTRSTSAATCADVGLFSCYNFKSSSAFCPTDGCTAPTEDFPRCFDPDYDRVCRESLYADGSDYCKSVFVHLCCAATMPKCTFDPAYVTGDPITPMCYDNCITALENEGCGTGGRFSMCDAWRQEGLVAMNTTNCISYPTFGDGYCDSGTASELASSSSSSSASSSGLGNDTISSEVDAATRSVRPFEILLIIIAVAAIA